MLKLYPKNLEKDELINRLTHSPGIILGLIYMMLLIIKGLSQGPVEIATYLIYSLTYILVFATSTIYHSQICSKRKDLFKKLDHASIYLFMGGCYTPFILLNMQSEYKYEFLAFVWILSIMGVIYKFYSSYKNTLHSTALYLLFGFGCFLVKGSLLDHIPAESFKFLVYGGLLYSIGAIFYVLSLIPYNHGIWHVFALAGSGCHFLAVYLAS